MTYTAGFDLGTTFTAAAVANEHGVSMINLSHDSTAAPSVLSISSDGFLAGAAAVSRGLVDPDSVAARFKRRLGDTSPLLIGGTPYSAHALMARLLEWAYGVVVEREGASPNLAAVTHPANWGPYKREMLDQVIAAAKLDCSVVTLTEPEAAAIAYGSTNRVKQGETFAVYDLGGGTFDAAVLSRTVGGFELQGQPAGIESLGGIDFDTVIFEQVLADSGLDTTELDSGDAAVILGLRELRRNCTLAKIALSESTDAAVPVMLPGLQTQVRVTRSEFEARIAPLIGDTIDALQRALGAAGVAPTDLSRILLVGGSSRIPLVGQMVSEAIGRPVAVDADPKNAIARGAAIYAQSQLRSHRETTRLTVPINDPVPPAAPSPPSPPAPKPPAAPSPPLPPAPKPPAAPTPKPPPAAPPKPPPVDPKPPPPVTPPGTEHDKSRKRLGFVGLGLVMAIALVGFLLIFGGDDESPETAEPITPDPVTVEPITPDPVTVEPITPDPVTVEPITPDPVTVEPITPVPQPSVVVGCSISATSVVLLEALEVRATVVPATTAVVFDFTHGDGAHIDNSPHTAFFFAPGDYDITLNWEGDGESGTELCGTVRATGVPAGYAACSNIASPNFAATYRVDVPFNPNDPDGGLVVRAGPGIDKPEVGLLEDGIGNLRLVGCWAPTNGLRPWWQLSEGGWASSCCLVQE